MAEFLYKARTSDGKLTQGKLRSPNQDRAAALLRSHGFTPLEVTAAEKVSIFNRNVFGGPASRKDLILFSRQLSSMIQAGVPVLQSLQAMQRQVRKQSFRELLRDLAYAVEGGDALSTAMSKHPNVFSPFFLGVVRTGEASGKLSHSLESLSDQMDQDYNFMQKVRASLVYPAFVVTVVVILSVIMLLFVMPQLTGLFADAGVQLPLPTRILIIVTTFVRRFWLLLILAAVALGLLLRSYLKTPDGRYTLSSWVLRLPLLSQLFQKIYLARLTSVLQTLFSSDVPVLDSLQLGRESMGNRVYRRILDDTARAVKDGASISSVWQHEPFIPPLLSTIVAVGEQSGNISDSFSEANRFFKRDVEAMLSSISTLIEPILIIALGIGVGIIVAAVLLPIYDLVLVL